MTATATAEDARMASYFYGVMLLGGLLASWSVATLAGTLLYVAVASGSLVWARHRFEHVLPFGWSPWYRILVVTVLLIASLLVIPSVVDHLVPTTPSLPIDELLPGYDGLLQALHLSMLAVLLVVGTLLIELFFRGVLYSLLLDWRGAAFAVAGSTAAFVGLWMVASGPQLSHSAALALGTGVVLAGSRWLTGSLAPAFVAQGLMALTGVAFLVLIGLEGSAPWNVK